MITVIDMYIFPVLVVVVALALLCLYLQTKKKRSSNDVTIPTPQDADTFLDFSVSVPEDRTEDQHHDGFPPRYSTIDHPPPYSLFDPKLTSICQGTLPPSYEMYPIMLPLAPLCWMTPRGISAPT